MAMMPSEDEQRAAEIIDNRAEALEKKLGMPSELAQHVAYLEKWASDNRRDARNDALAFWSLKLPAIFSAGSAGVLAHFNMKAVSLIASAAATICIIIDGVLPRGMLRNMHLRAAHDIGIMVSQITTKWRGRSGTANSDNFARKLINESLLEMDRIAKYVATAETALKYDNSGIGKQG